MVVTIPEVSEIGSPFKGILKKHSCGNHGGTRTRQAVAMSRIDCETWDLSGRLPSGKLT